VLKRRQTPAAHRISSDYVDGRRVAHFSREIVVQCEVNTREKTSMSQKKLTIRGIARPIFLAILLSAMIAAVAGTPVSGPISRPMAANAALGPAPAGVRSGGPQSGTPANQSGAEAAQSLDPAASSGTTLTYNPGSTVKVQQIIGDCDWAVQAAKGSCQATASRTISNANIAGTDVGPSFEQHETGKLIFMFGDTISNDPSARWSTSSLPKVEYHHHDPIAWSTATDGDAPVPLSFFLTPAPIPTPFFVEPSFIDGTKVEMGGDDVPHAGLDCNGKTYIMINTGADFSLPDPHQNYFSVLATWDGTTNASAFTALRPYSMLPNGHFIVTSLHGLTPSQAGGSASTQGILTYGIGAYKLSQIYLSYTFEIPSATFAGAPGFEDGLATKYFTGLTNGQPMWSTNESDAMPVVSDVVQGPTIDHLSVAYSPDLGLWLMTFGGGRDKQGDGTPTNGTPATDGVYFTYAPAPWGPWATPQLIFNATRDTFKIKVKGSAQRGTYPLLFAGKDDTGRERDATLTLVVQ
jgi:hypothetical protein